MELTKQELMMLHDALAQAQVQVGQSDGPKSLLDRIRAEIEKED